MKIIKSHKNAFTLIELIVVMTIMTILTMASYTPFSYYKTKQKVKNSTKIITQTLYNARSNSIYGILHINPTLT
jgi:prepilin-type N-terminal cleavage/methylation domain-containing protein